MLRTYIEKLLVGKNLTEKEGFNAVNEILNGANPNQIAAFLVLLRAKKETAAEILGIVQAMRKKMVTLSVNTPVLDIVGTGGDGANTINISTGAAILAASCGVKIAKHGNRSISSQCGSADVLEALGVNINMKPGKVTECIEKIGIGFCFAPNFHPAMQSLKTVRNNLGVPTCFNILGPLLNPAKAEYLLIGAFNHKLMHIMAKVLFKLGVKHALVFHGNGMDELSCVGPTSVLEVTPAGIKVSVLDSSDFGLQKCSVADLAGGTPPENAKKLREIFDGAQGAITNTLLLNAAAALYVYGITTSIEQAIPIVKNSIETGKAIQLLNDFVNFSQLGGCDE